MTKLSNFDIVKQCDKFPYMHDRQVYDETVAPYYHFQVEGCSATPGYMLASVVKKFAWQHFWDVDHDRKTVTLMGATKEERDTRVAVTLKQAKDRDGDVVVNIERAGSALFGIMIYGIHMTGYVNTADGLKTYPSMLDNTVGGGIASGDSPFNSLVREATEEASFPEPYVREHAKICGSILYLDIRDERAGGEIGLLQPECIYVYDMELLEGMTPFPNDKEAQGFQLWGVPELQGALSRGEFKTNCGLVLIDFFVRHGIITPENEKDYIEIVARLHRRLEFPTT